MDPVTVVVTALLAGTAGGLSSTASTAVQQAYDALCAAVRTRLPGGDEAALDTVTTDPDRLKDALSDVGVDPELLAAARAVLGAQQGKYTIDARDATNVQAGDFNTQNIRLS